MTEANPPSAVANPVAKPAARRGPELTGVGSGPLPGPTPVTLLTQADCTLCEHARAVLARVGRDHPLTVEEVDLASVVGRELAVRHGVLFAPGVLLADRPFSYGRLSEKKLRRALGRTARPGQPASGGPG